MDTNTGQTSSVRDEQKTRRELRSELTSLRREVAEQTGTAPANGESRSPSLAPFTSGVEFSQENGTPLPIIDGTPVLIGESNVVRSMAEQKVMHEELSDILECLPDPVFAIDHEKRVTVWNRAMEKMTGVTREHMLGKGDYAYAVPFYGEKRPMAIDLVFSPEVGELYPHAQKDGSVFSVEVSATMPLLGRSAYLSVTAAPLHDKKGNTIGAIQTLRDITEQKRVEEALRESEERYRTATENSYDGIVMVRGGTVLYANRRLVEILGYDDPTEITGQCITLAVHPDDRERVAEINRRRERNEAAPIRYEFKGIRKDGQILFIEVSVINTVYQGEVVTLACLRDVTDRKSLDAQLLHAQKMEAIGTLAGGIAHDFNNILMALMGYANVLKMKIDPSDPLRVYVDPIVTVAARAANVTQSLLAFSRKNVMELKPHKINLLIKDVEKLLRRLLTEDIEIVFSYDSAVMTVMVDSTQIDQVLINLATNARDAMPRGGRLCIETREVAIDALFKKSRGYGEPGPYALVSVSDNGIGMDKQTMAKIYEPFFTTKAVGKGTGLGLAIAYGIVKQHNGYIEVTSEPNKGTTFLIYLPLVGAQMESELALPAPAPESGTETILLAEDDTDIRHIFGETLRLAGYTVVETIDGKDAYEEFMEHKDFIKLLIFDVVMPKRNGREAYEAIRAVKEDIKVLFISGYTGDVVLDKGVATESNYLSKPVTGEGLLRKVREVLDEK